MKLEYIKPLDGIRAIAIFLVIIWHYVGCLVKTNFSIIPVEQIQFATSLAWSGVDLFFVLSGFLIGRILINDKGSDNYFKRFYMRRIFRIFPAYYFIVSAFIIIVLSGLSNQIPWLTNNPFPIYSYLLFLQNFQMTGYEFGASWLSVTWSLAIEEQFYLILPLIIYYANPKSLPKILIAGIIFAPIFRAILPGLSPYVLLPARMDSLLIGVLIAYYYLNGKLEIFFKEKQGILVSLLVILFFLMLFYAGLPVPIGGVIIHSILALFYGVLIVLAITLNPNNTFNRILSAGFLSFFAKISFMMYLTHQIFSGLFHELILNQDPQINNYRDFLVTMLSLLTTIFFSTISYYYFERPIINWGNKYVGGDSTKSAIE